jgi:DNA repair protein RadD
MKLRPYQTKGIDLIRERYKAEDKKIMFFLATGGGKSIVFKKFITDVVKQWRVLFLVRRRELIFQAKQKHFSHLDCSVVMGSEKGFDPNCRVQVCSIDTLQRRLNQYDFEFLKEFEAVVVDEAHDTTSEKYREVLNSINFKICVGLTATPFKIGNKVHNWWQSCVKPIEMHELRDQGYLVDARVYAPKVIDVSGVKKVAGEFHQGQLFDRVTESKIIGDIVETYKNYGKGKPAILFGVNIQHSQLMAHAFNEAGIKAVHCDQSHTKDERAFAIRQLEKGEIQVLCNVNIFSTGVDIPSVEVGIMARPTMSEALYIQQVGRFLRPFKICANCGNKIGGEKECWKCHSTTFNYEKPFAIILDHANNTSRHGLPFKVRQAQMEKADLKRKDGEVKIRVCQGCFAVLEGVSKCPFCEEDIINENQKEIKHEKGELQLIEEETEIKKKYRNLLWRENKFNRPPKEKFFLLHKEFGDKCFNVVEFPSHIFKEIQKNGLLFSASKLIEASHAKNSKRVYS